MQSGWDKYSIEELTKMAEDWQTAVIEAEQEMELSEYASQKQRMAFRKKKDAEATLEELLGWTEHKGKFVEDAIAPNGMSVGHYEVEIFHKGIIQKRLEEPERLLDESNLGDRFKGRTFASFDAKRDREAFDQCSRYANDEKLMERKRNGLILAGGFGSGKTHLAAAICNALVGRGIPVLFGTSVEHLENIRNDFEHTGMNLSLSKMKSIPVLVIDDLGKEKKTDWTKQVLFDVVNYRYEHKLPTIITTNLISNGNFDALANHVEGAVWSRFCEMCNIIETASSDYRQGA